MKGIILAGGLGSRLYPLTIAISKQLLPVYNKPMIYYPLSVLMFSGIREVLVITKPDQIPNFQRLLSTGEQWGMEFTYKSQPHPDGLAQAFILGKDFIGENPVCLILGDNIFFGHGLPIQLKSAANLTDGGLIFAHQVKDPNNFGVIEIDENGNAVSIEEKPKRPKSNLAIPGLYYYDHQVISYAETLKPSVRGELEITDLNQIYLDKGDLRVEILGRGVAWLDAGLSSSLMQASQFIQAVEERQGIMISCLEEIAYRMGFISLEQVARLTKKMGNNSYKDYLNDFIKRESDKI